MCRRKSRKVVELFIRSARRRGFFSQVLLSSSFSDVLLLPTLVALPHIATYFRACEARLCTGTRKNTRSNFGVCAEAMSCEQSEKSCSTSTLRSLAVTVCLIEYSHQGDVLGPLSGALAGELP